MKNCDKPPPQVSQKDPYCSGMRAANLQVQISRAAGFNHPFTIRRVVEETLHW